MIQPAFEILNQRGTPMFFSDIYANIPTAGIVGRIFISTDTKEFYRDTGTTWELIGGPGSGTITGSGTAGTLPIWTSSSVLGNSSLLEGASKISTIKDIQADAYYLSGMTAGNGALYWTSDRVTLANYNVGGIVHIEVNGGSLAQVLSSDLSSTFYGNVLATQKVGINKSVPSVALDVVGRSYILDTSTYSTGTIQSQTIDKQLTIPNGASISNGVGLTSQLVGGTTTFQGSVTIPNTTPLANNLISNSFAFSGAGTITLTQAAGLRTSAASMIQSFFSGSASSTITHYSAQAIYGFFNINSGSITPVIQNAYMLLINNMNDYSHTFTFNNRWGIYQAGASDINYFASKILIGETIDFGYRLYVNGTIGTSNSVTIGDGGTGLSRLYALSGSDLVFNAGGDRMVVRQTGLVGIGTLSPSYKFQVNGSSGTIARITDGTNNLDFYAGSGLNEIAATTKLLLSTNGSTAITITSGQLVGIGTTSPTDLLTLQKNDGRIRFNTTAGTRILLIGDDFGSGGFQQIYDASGNVKVTFSASTSYFNGTGNLLIGSSNDPGQKLYLNGSFRIDGQTSGTAGGNSGQHLIINCDGTTYKIALLNN